MLYHKIPFEDGTTTTAELHEDEIITFCPKCGKEQEVDSDLLIQIINHGDFGGTKVYCEKCTERR